jgi:RNA polymerase sigma factor (sigma-70 family)
MDSWAQVLADLPGERLVALKRQAYLLCGDDDQAEDLVQDALVRAFSRARRAPGPEAADAYIRKIMINLFIDHARRQARWTRKVPFLAVTETAPDPADTIVSRHAIQDALDCLSPQQRACVVLRYFQDLPVTRIAADLHLAEGTVKRYLSEAMIRIAGQRSSVQEH